MHVKIVLKVNLLKIDKTLKLSFFLVYLVVDKFLFEVSNMISIVCLIIFSEL